jgi:hypothetical protein
LSNTNQIIEVIVSPTGETTVQTKGFTGSACREASKFIERALGEATAEKLTAEFHQTANTQQQVQQR